MLLKFLSIDLQIMDLHIFDGEELSVKAQILNLFIRVIAVFFYAFTGKNLLLLNINLDKIFDKIRKAKLIKQKYKKNKIETYDVHHPSKKY